MTRLGYLCLLWAAFVVGCTGQLPDMATEQGSVQMALAANGPDGSLYRLRDATIDYVGPTNVTLDSDTFGDSRIVFTGVNPGNYSITLRPGWRFEHVDTNGNVTSAEATLVSPNPQQAHVAPAGTTQVRLRFTIAGLGDVVLSPGEIDLGVEVSAASCQPAPQSGCSAGKKCTDFQGNSRCAPDGNVPEGGACVAESGVDDCVAGTICQQGLCARICTLGTSDCACSRLSGLFQDNQNIGTCAPSCDLLAQQCPAGQGCYFVSATSGTCATAGGTPVGGTCQFTNQCVPGASCAIQYQDVMQPECAQHCDPNMPSCGANQQCALLGEPTPGTTTAGICINCLRMPEACSQNQ
jgi:hypothetical protein